jgi:hypothetical protein
MKSIFKKQSVLIFLAGLVLSAVLLWPFVYAPFFTHHDDVQVIRTHQMVKCFEDKQFPCRWVPDLGGLYGYPLFNYYAPLPYYVGALIYYTIGNYIITAKLLFALSFLLSYSFMFLLGRKLWGDLGGLFSGVLYAYAPYHAVDLYVRGAMGEMWGLIFFPAILWSLLSLYEKRRILNTLLLSLTFALLILSHNLSAMIFVGVIAVVIVFLLLFGKELKTNKQKLLFLGYSMGGILLGFLLAAFYWLPAMVEKELVHVDTTTYGYFYFTEHFKGIRQVVFSNFWGWGPSIREVPGGERDGMSYQVGWIHMVFWLIALWGVKVFWRKDPFIAKILLLFSAMAMGAIFMIHPRSEFIWKLIEPLKYIQFPWRFLMLVIFFVSLVGGVIPKVLDLLNLKLWSKRKVLIVVLLLFPIVSYNFYYFQPERFIYTTDKELLTGVPWDKQIKRSIFDYLPKSATEPPAELAPGPYEILTETPAEVTNFKKGTDWMYAHVKTGGHTILRFSQYYFPGWKIFVNGKEATIDYDNHLGLMSLILGEGEFDIDARLYNTPIRTTANSLSVFGLVIMIVLLIGQSSRIRKGLLYYFKALKG